MAEHIKNGTGDGDNAWKIDSDNAGYVKMIGSDGNVINNFVDSNNETTTPLLSGQTFTGASTEILDYASIGLMIYTDVNSANDGLVVQYSFDNSTWRDGEQYTIPAGMPKFFTPPKQGRYYRVKYTNNGSNQTEFHIHCLLSKQPIKWSSHNINDNLNDDDDGELVVSVLKLRTAQNTWVSASATGGGNFKVSLEEYDDSLLTSPLPVRIIDSRTQRESEIDNITYALVSIDTAHHELHEGNHFYVKDFTSIAASSTFDLLFVSGTIEPHMIIELEGTQGTQVVVYEGTTTSANGTSLTVFNRYRASATTCGCNLYHTPTVTSVGTRIAGYSKGTSKIAGGQARSNNELILKASTKYLVRITNLSVSAANIVDFLADWYEHID